MKLAGTQKSSSNLTIIRLPEFQQNVFISQTILSFSNLVQTIERR